MSLSRDAAPGGGRCLELGVEMPRQVGDGRVIEQLGQIDEAGEITVDVVVNLDQLERARADLEQVVVHVDSLARQRRFANRLQARFELGARFMSRRSRRLTQRLQLPEFRVELAVDVRLFQ